jgi:hypothetical protein
MLVAKLLEANKKLTDQVVHFLESMADKRICVAA